MARKKKSEQPPKQVQEILRRQAIINEWYAKEPDEEKERLIAERNAAVALVEKIEAEIKEWRSKEMDRTHELLEHEKRLQRAQKRHVVEELLQGRFGAHLELTEEEIERVWSHLNAPDDVLSGIVQELIDKKT